MLTYQLQSRVLRVQGDPRLVFPADVEIEMKLAPPQPFGAAGGPCRTAKRATDASVRYDANTGRGTIASKEPLDPVDVRVEYQNLILAVRGDVVTVNMWIETPKELHDLLLSLLCGVPILLNVDFVDPPYVVYMKGVLGGVPFRWELAESQFEFDITTTAKQEERLVAMIERLTKFSGPRNRQVLAALHYFHKACRLLISGTSPWEFMAEAILNFAKVLQALFGESMEHAREGLRRLGYPDGDIERDFIPVMALRNTIDVGHVMMSILKESDLGAIYQYLAGAEGAFRELLQRVLERVAAGALTFPEITELAADADKRRVIDRIVTAWGGTTHIANDTLN